MEKDKKTQYTNSGIHKDDLLFNINNNSIKRFGSQGQQKSFLIALKLAQFEYIKNKTNIPPILLLDDIFDKLDQNRVELIMQLSGMLKKIQKRFLKIYRLIANK